VPSQVGISSPQNRTFLFCFCMELDLGGNSTINFLLIPTEGKAVIQHQQETTYYIISASVEEWSDGCMYAASASSGSVLTLHYLGIQ
jgi:hypothetical protein